MTAMTAASQVRAKMVGVLMRDARQTAGKTTKECADVLGCSNGAYLAYENGDKSPSLPELEVLAYFFGLPLKHFWSQEVRSEKPKLDAEFLAVASIAHLRHRIIGAELRKARLAAKIKIKDLSAKTHIPTGRLSNYELGQTPIPIPDLEALTSQLGLRIEDLFEPRGTVGEWDRAHRASERFEKLPADLQEFVCQPANEPYLRLAQRLSELPSGKLRGIAESLLDITY
jgi:transcriptional regulator with XRE-family HTH domain